MVRRLLLLMSLLVVLMLLTACGGAPPVTSWPGFVVPGDTAYLASADELLAINVTGDLAGATLPGWPQKSPNASMGYYAQPALAPDGKTLYVATEQMNGNSGSVQAWMGVERGSQTTPVLKWSYPFTDTDYLPGNIYGAVVLDKGVLYFGDGKGVIYALDAETGRPKWPAPVHTTARIWSSVVIDDQNVYAASQDHFLYAVNKASGSLVWTFPAEGTNIDALVGSPTIYDGTVYVGSFGSVLYAVDAKTGRQNWSFKADGALWDGPALVDGTLYFGDRNGNVYALDAATGQNKKWTAKVEGGVKMTPLVADGVVYVGTEGNKLYAFNANNGQTVWAQPYQGRDGENLLVTPVISGNTLVVVPNIAGGDPVRLIGLNKNTGALLWRYPPQKSQ